MAKKGQKFNTYTVEFREEVMQRYLNGERSPTTLAKEYDIPVGTIKTWIKAYRHNVPIGKQKKGGKGRPKESEIDYKERYEILKKFLTFTEAQREKK